MKTKPIKIGLFICLCLLQTAIPISMIVQKESVLRDGVQFRFLTEPFDPYDAFRGRFVALRIKESTYTIPNGEEFSRNQKVYVHIDNDDKNFAKIVNVSTKRPKNGLYFITHINYINGNKMNLRIPFDRYYVEEKIAPEVERLYRQQTRENQTNVYVAVRIKSGKAVLEDVYIGSEPLMEFVKKNTNKSATN